MEKLKTNIGRLVLSLVLVGASVLPASAAGISLRNELTGPRSRNINRVDISSRYSNDHHRDHSRHSRDWNDWSRSSRRFNSRTDIDVRSDIDVDARSGNIRINRNTFVGDVSTGDVDVNVEVDNRF